MLMGFVGCLGAIYEIRCLLGLVSSHQPMYRKQVMHLNWSKSPVHILVTFIPRSLSLILVDKN